MLSHTFMDSTLSDSTIIYGDAVCSVLASHILSNLFMTTSWRWLKVLSSSKQSDKNYPILDKIMQSAMEKHKESEILLLIVYYEMISHYDYPYYCTYLCLDTMINVVCGFINILDAALVLLNLWSYNYLLLFLQEFCPFRSPSHLHLCSWLLEIKWTHFMLHYKFLLSWIGHFLLVCQDNLQFHFCHLC